jgi:hypothetical protein
VQALLPRLSGDLTMETLADQRRILKAVATIVASLKDEMDASVISAHPADEQAVSSYFLYAHALSVFNRTGDGGSGRGGHRGTGDVRSSRDVPIPRLTDPGISL